MANIAEVVLRVKADASQVPAVTRALQDVEQDAERAGAALEDMGDSAGHVGQNSAKLAGALDLVAPGLGQVALGLADIADVGEVAAAVASALGVSMGALAAVAAPLAIVVAGIALAWSSYSASAEEAASYQERLNAAIEAVEPITKRAAAEIDKLAVNLGQMTQVEYDDLQIRNEFAASLDANTEKLRAEKTAIKEKMEEIGKATHEYLKYQDRLHEVSAELAAATAENEKGQAAALQNAEFTRERAESEKVLAERLRVKADAERKATSATKDNTTALDKQREALFKVLDAAKEVKMLEAEGALAPGRVDIRTEASEQLAKLQAELQQITSGNPAQVFDNLKLAQAALNVEFSRGVMDLEQYNAALLLIEKTGADYRNGQELARFQRASAAGSAIGGSVLGGSVAGLASTLGPMIGTAIAGPVGSAVGEALGQAVSFLEALGQTSIAEIKANMLSSAANIRAGLEMLPSLLSELMPDLIQAIASGFIQALPELIALQYKLLAEMALFPLRILQGFVQGMGEWWASIGGLQGLGQSVVEALGRWWRDAWAAVRDFLKHPLDRDQDGRRLGGEAIDASKRAMSFLWSGEFATGTDYVPRTGLALVHQGERIETARAGGGGMGARTSASGGDVHLHLSGFAVGTADQLIRELNKHLGAGNRRLSWSG